MSTCRIRNDCWHDAAGRLPVTVHRRQLSAACRSLIDCCRPVAHRTCSTDHRSVAVTLICEVRVFRHESYTVGRFNVGGGRLWSSPILVIFGVTLDFSDFSSQVSTEMSCSKRKFEPVFPPRVIRVRGLTLQVTLPPKIPTGESSDILSLIHI